MISRLFRGINYQVTTFTVNGQTLNGTRKPDWIEVLGGNNTIKTGEGADVILAGVAYVGIVDEPYVFLGQAITASILANPGNYSIYAGCGNDYVSTGSGDDFVDLGDGDDIYNAFLFGDPTASIGNDTIRGGNGNDRISLTGSGSMTLDGGNGDDVLSIFELGLHGSPNLHNVNAGSGNDGIDISSLGNVVLDAGRGDDAAFVSGKDGKINLGSGNDSGFISFTTAHINLGDGDDQVFATFGDFFGSPTNVNNAQILGGSGKDIIGLSSANGTALADGGAGDDILFSVNYFSSTGYILKGGLGNDKIFSGTGDDTIYAGAGNDTINLRGGTVNYQVRFPINYELSPRSEEVIGGGNDTVYLEGGRDTVVLGSAGRATIYGFGGDDRLDVTGLNATFRRHGSDTLIQSGGNTLGVLVGYTGRVGC